MNFGLLGASKTGTSIAYHLFKNGYKPRFLWNRTAESLSKTNQYIPFENATNRIDEFVNDCDFIVISVADDFIGEVVKDFCIKNDLKGLKIFHTSGAFDSQILKVAKKYNCQTGSFHPVISISSIEEGINLIPITTFTCEGEIVDDLIKIGNKIGKKGVSLTSDQKKSIHLSAVFMNNYLAGMMEKIKLMNQNADISSKINKDILEEITKQTINRSWHNDIKNVLTGPIKRGDIETIKNHLDLLKNDELFQQLYKNFGNILLKFVNHDIEKLKKIENIFKTCEK